MWKRIMQFLKSPTFEGDTEKTDAAKKSYPLFLVLFFASLIYAVITPFQLERVFIQFGFVVITSLLSLICLILSRSGNTKMAEIVLLIGLWLISTTAVFISGGINSPSLGMLIILVIMAGFLRGQQALLFWAGIAVISNIAFYFDEVFFPNPLTSHPFIFLTSNIAFILAAAFIFYLALGQIERTFAQLRNQLDEKKRIETELRQSEMRFRQFTNLSPMPIVVVTLDGKFDFINQQFINLYGFTLPDIPTTDSFFRKAYPNLAYREKAVQDWYAQIEHISQHGGVARAEYEIRDTWNKPHCVSFQASIFEEKAIIIFNDVTEHRKMETEIKENEILYRSLFENVQDSIFVMTENYFIECNQKTLELFGCKKSQIIGKTPDSFSPEYQPNGSKSSLAAKNYIKKALNGETQRFEWVHTRLDGTSFNAHVTLSKISLPEKIYILAQVRDISKQKQDQAIIKRSSRRMDTLYNLDTVINTSFDLKTILTMFLNMIVEQAEADAAAFLIYDDYLQLLKFESGLGFHTNLEQATAQIPIGFSLAGKAAISRKTLHIPDLSKIEKNETLDNLVNTEKFVAYYAIPMIVKGDLKGILEIFQRSGSHNGSEWLSYIETLANRAAVAIDNTQLFTNLQQANLEMQLTYDITLEGWVHLLSLREKESLEHAQKIVRLTEKLSRMVGIQDKDLVHILRGALLHDIGKIVIPDHILFKPGPLDEEEWQIVRKHPTAAFSALNRIDYLKPATDIPYCHHEWWNGSGYPRGLVEQEIPLAARIFTVIDVWDALSQDRPYRKAWDSQKIRDHLKEQSGIQFDPFIVKAFLALLEEDPQPFMIH